MAVMADVDHDYFLPAATGYIEGDVTSASNLVAQGLSVFPDDGKLLRLKELIEKQQQQQNNQDQNQQDQQQNQDQQQQDQQNPEQQQSQQDQQQDQQQNPDQQNPEQQQDEAPQPEPQRAEQMSQDEAQQLLDAMKQEEEAKRLQLHPVMGRPVNVEKDW